MLEKPFIRVGDERIKKQIRMKRGDSLEQKDVWRRLIAILEEKEIILINKFAKTKDTKKKIRNKDNLILASEILNRFQF